MEKIDEQEVNKLLGLLEKYNIRNNWLIELCNIDSLMSMTKVQYNLFLLFVERIEGII